MRRFILLSLLLLAACIPSVREEQNNCVAGGYCLGITADLQLYWESPSNLVGGSGAVEGASLWTPHCEFPDTPEGEVCPARQSGATAFDLPTGSYGTRVALGELNALPTFATFCATVADENESVCVDFPPE